MLRKLGAFTNLSIVALALMLASACGPLGQGEPVSLRLGVSLTPQELATFQPAIEALQETHPDWDIVLETTPLVRVAPGQNTLHGRAEPLNALHNLFFIQIREA